MQTTNVAPPIVETAPAAVAAQPAAQASAPTACLEQASVVPVMDQTTGQQAMDQGTGLPMWLQAGQDNGVVVLGNLCDVQIPTGLPDTGDGTAATVVTNESPAENVDGQPGDTCLTR